MSVSYSDDESSTWTESLQAGSPTSEASERMDRLWLIAVLFSCFLIRAGNSQQRGGINSRADISQSWVNSAENFINNIILQNGSYAYGFHSGFSGSLLGVRRLYGSSKSSSSVDVSVWAANRNKLVGINATLDFTAEGNLVLRDEKRLEVWSTGTAGRGVLYMEMLETGNLVLTDGKQFLWESFNYPTDVLLPGQVLKLGMKLTSSISEEGPAEGSYVLEMMNNGLSLSARGSPPQTYWSTFGGPAGDIGTPYALLTKDGNILFFMTSSSEAAYSKSGSPRDSDGNFSKLVLNSSNAQYLQLTANGNLELFAETGAGPTAIFSNQNCSDWPGSCSSYSVCKAGQCSCVGSDSPDAAFTPIVLNLPSSGCRPVIPLSGCGDHHFITVNAVDYTPIRYLPVLTVNSSPECERLCSSNCSCKMAFYWTGSGRAFCSMFDAVYTLKNFSYSINFTSSPAIALIKVQNPVPATTDAKRLLMVVLLSVLLSLLAFGAVITSTTFYRRRDRRGRRKEELALDTLIGLPRRFSYKQLQQATGNFRRKLGQGAFGTVFLAELPHNEKVAVKRLDNASQGHKDFKTEVSIIGRVRHMNLVQLRGFCAENEHRMLVYELVVNSSLDKWLFPQKEAEGRNHFLNWDARLNIALGAARGLAYLHEGCSEKILHLDVKPQNILLDADLNTKVCDFGLSRLVSQDESSVFTTIRGTPGYMAPEWLHYCITEKVDVYSYGVVLLELLSGQRCLDTTRLEEGSSRLHFPSWASKRIERGGSLADLVDTRLGAEVESKIDEMAMLLKLALLCTQEEPARRPSMGRVVQMLEDMMVVPPS